MIPIDLIGKSALITGGSQGIGHAITTRLHEAGACVTVLYFDGDDGTQRRQADELVHTLGERAHAVGGDVRSMDSVAAAVAQLVDRTGGLEIVVNNAGIIRDRTLKRMSADDWSAVLDTNLTGVFNVCKASQPHLRKEGRIVNLASIAGIMGFFGQTNYAAAKAGVIGLTRVLSRELARQRITVNAIAPGMIHTPMAETVPEDVQQKMCESIPLGSFGEPEDIANTAVFLCSPLARYITGQTIQVNGGWIG